MMIASPARGSQAGSLGKHRAVNDPFLLLLQTAWHAALSQQPVDGVQQLLLECLAAACLTQRRYTGRAGDLLQLMSLLQRAVDSAATRDAQDCAASALNALASMHTA